LEKITRKEKLTEEDKHLCKSKVLKPLFDYFRMKSEFMDEIVQTDCFVLGMEYRYKTLNANDYGQYYDKEDSKSTLEYFHSYQSAKTRLLENVFKINKEITGFDEKTINPENPDEINLLLKFRKNMRVRYKNWDNDSIILHELNLKNGERRIINYSHSEYENGFSFNIQVDNFPSDFGKYKSDWTGTGESYKSWEYCIKKINFEKNEVSSFSKYKLKYDLDEEIKWEYDT
jgi:hypothetical protein